MGLTLGPSGFPFYGADTGGYRHSPGNRELFIRWFQQTALSSVMQVGAKHGMQTLEAALLELVNSGVVSIDEARSRHPSSKRCEWR